MNEAETHAMSIDQIEGVSTQFPSFDSGLARALYRARTKNIKDLDAYELKVALENKVGLKFLVPVALQMLRSDVFSGGGVYEGALMQCILGLPAEVWIDSNLVLEVSDLMDKFLERMVTLPAAQLKYGFPAVTGAYDRFLHSNMSALVKAKRI